MTNVLSFEQLMKEAMNATPIYTKDAEEFARYLGYVLQRAQNFEIMDEIRAKSIVSLIGASISKRARKDVDPDDFDSTEIISKNILYAISLYLSSMEVYDAFKELDAIVSSERADIFLNKVETFIGTETFEPTKKLEKIGRLTALRLWNIGDYYTNLLTFAYEVAAFNRPGNRLLLGNFHQKSIESYDFGTYMFLTDFEKSSWSLLEKLRAVIDEFVMEISIFEIANGKQVARFKLKEEMDNLAQDGEEEIELDQRYQQKLNQLREEYNKKIAGALAGTYYDEVCGDDEVLIERKYREEKQKLEEEWERASEALRKHQEFRNTFRVECGSRVTSLRDVIKEYALFHLAEKGKITYPQNSTEKGRLLSKLDMDVAISEFLEGFDKQLSVEQIVFLRKAQKTVV